MRSWIALAAVALAFLLAAGTVSNPFVLDLLFFVAIYATLGTGWNWVSGYAGQVSFGHALFFGCGAYASAVIVTHGGSPWLAIPAGIVVALVMSIAIGYPTFALRGHYFSIATIAIAAIAEIVARNVDWLGGASGIELPIAHGGLVDLQWGSKAPYVVCALVLLVLATATTIVMERSYVGYYLRAIRANQDAAASAGIDHRAYKLLAFAAGAAFCAAAGSLYAQSTLFVDPESTLGLPISIAIALVGVVGGVGTVWGPLVGATIWVILARYVAAVLGGSGRGIDLILYGGLICVLAALRPDGIVGAFRDFRRARAIRRARTTATR